MTRPEQEPIPITGAGIAALKQELEDLKRQRPEIVARVASARADGDLSENFAYHDGRRDLGMLDGRVQTIEAVLANATLIDEAPGDGTIRLGSQVVVSDEFGDSEYALVGPAEANVARGMISIASPLGAALVGKRAGDTVTFSSPGGERKATVRSVKP